MTLVSLVANRVDHLKLLLELGSKSILINKHYMGNDLSSYLDILKQNYKDSWYILDGGGYQLRLKEMNEQEIEKEHENYYNFIKKYGKYFKSIMELDVGSPEIRKKWREKCIKAVGGDKFYAIYHLDEEKSFEKFLDDVNCNVAIPSPGARFVTKSDKKYRSQGNVLVARKYVKEAMKRGKKVHLLASVNVNMLRNLKEIFSTNSSAWASSMKFGDFHFFVNGRIDSRSWDSVSVNLVDKIAKKYSINEETKKKALKGDGSSIVVFSVIAYIEMQKHFGAKSIWKEVRELFDDDFGNVEEKEFRVRNECQICMIGDGCPYYDENALECPYVENIMDNVVKHEGEIVEETLKFVIEERLKRYLRGRMIERVEGGILDRHITTIEDGIAKLIDTYLKLKYPERYGKGNYQNNEETYETILLRLDEYESSKRKGEAKE